MRVGLDLHDIFTIRRQGHHADISHGTNFPSEEDEMPQKRLRQSYGYFRVRKGKKKESSSSFLFIDFLAALIR